MYSMSGDPPSWVCVRPSDGLRGLVVVADVLHDLPPQISHRGEDAARENVAFNLRKPELNLIEPRRVRRREVKVHMGMLRQERSDLLGLCVARLSRMKCNARSAGCVATTSRRNVRKSSVV